jgi:hypothetical protein
VRYDIYMYVVRRQRVNSVLASFWNDRPLVGQDLLVQEVSRPVFPNRRSAGRYRALASSTYRAARGKYFIVEIF